MNAWTENMFPGVFLYMKILWRYVLICYVNIIFAQVTELFVYLQNVKSCLAAYLVDLEAIDFFLSADVPKVLLRLVP